MKYARFSKDLLLALVALASCRSVPLPEGDAKQQPAPTAPDDAAPDSGAPNAGSDAATGGRPSASGGSRGDGGRGASPEPTGGMPSAPDDTTSGGDGNSVGEQDPFDAPARCTSNVYRDPNESEGPPMNPGFPCITCHAAANAASSDADAPLLAFAGTLYPTAHEPNSCVGSAAENAEVVLTDATHTELRALANTSGNFLLKDAVLTPPFSVKVLFQGRERAAATPHQNGDCNACHSQVGDQGAPGRVVLP